MLSEDTLLLPFHCPPALAFLSLFPHAPQSQESSPAHGEPSLLSVPAGWEEKPPSTFSDPPTHAPLSVPGAGSVVAPSEHKKRIGASGNKRCSRMVCSPDSAGSALKGNFIL